VNSESLREENAGLKNNYAQKIKLESEIERNSLYAT
jgi:hypothetical protein